MSKGMEIQGMKEFQAALKRLDKTVQSDITLDALEAGGRVIQTYTQNNIRTKLNRHPTGNMANNTDVRREGKAVLAGVFGVVYAKIHEFGGVITARLAKYLHFVIDGQHVQVKRVTIPARPYLRPAVDEHMPEIANAIGAALGRLLEKAARK